MLRRILSLMLVPALLANQLALCCAHTHQGGTGGDRSARPHVHLSGDSFGPHSHSHEHHAGHKHPHSGHEHAQPGAALPDEGSKTNLDFVTNLPVEHDSDAVYFGDKRDLLINVSRVSENNCSSATLYLDPAVPRVSKLHCRITVSRAGPFTPYSGTIFLQTRRLLL